MRLKDKSFLQLMKYIPKRLASQVTGKVMSWEPPRPVQSLALKAFSQVYGVKVEEAEAPLESYKSLNSFFTRKLKSGARPIQGQIVHPADGEVISSGGVEKGQIFQVKGLNYSLGDFLADAQLALAFEGGSFWTTYLSPRDYHRVHFPTGGTVVRVQRVQGQLWPVNSTFYKYFANLFIENERVIVHMETPVGKVAVVMVGATNVGKIEVFLEGQKETTSVAAGDELGVFHFGSTVVTLFEKPLGSLPESGQKVQFGQSVAPSIALD